MLSDRSIMKALGKRIVIYPFEPERMSGESIDLTASNMAWSQKDKESIVKNDIITIKPGDTGIIVTKENVSFDRNYAAICHNRVSFSTKGLIHAASPIKAGWCGQLLISLYNSSSEVQTIRVGDPIIVLTFHRIRPGASPDRVTPHSPGRTGVLSSLGITLEEEERISIEAPGNHKALCSKLLEDVNFINHRKKYRLKTTIRLVSVLIALVIAVIFQIVFIHRGCFLHRDVLLVTLTVTCGAAFGLFLDFLKR